MLAGRVFSVGSAIVIKHVRRGRQGSYHIVNEHSVRWPSKASAAFGWETGACENVFAV